jgi:hypothetical protein
MVVCPPLFPVIDYFVHSTQGDVFFVQMSQSKYSKHGSRLPDLFSPDMGRHMHPSAAAAVQEPKSVFRFFYERVGRPCPDWERAELPDRAYYVYITTRLHYQRKAQVPERQDVVYVPGEVCRHFPPDWDVPLLYEP